MPPAEAGCSRSTPRAASVVSSGEPVTGRLRESWNCASAACVPAELAEHTGVPIERVEDDFRAEIAVAGSPAFARGNRPQRVTHQLATSPASPWKKALRLVPRA